jgi:hypothetical protein
LLSGKSHGLALGHAALLLMGLARLVLVVRVVAKVLALDALSLVLPLLLDRLELITPHLANDLCCKQLLSLLSTQSR